VATFTRVTKTDNVQPHNSVTVVAQDELVQVSVKRSNSHPYIVLLSRSDWDEIVEVTNRG